MKIRIEIGKEELEKIITEHLKRNNFKRVDNKIDFKIEKVYGSGIQDPGREVFQHIAMNVEIDHDAAKPVYIPLECKLCGKPCPIENITVAGHFICDSCHDARQRVRQDDFKNVAGKVIEAVASIRPEDRLTVPCMECSAPCPADLPDDNRICDSCATKKADAHNSKHHKKPKATRFCLHCKKNYARNHSNACQPCWDKDFSDKPKG